MTDEEGAFRRLRAALGTIAGEGAPEAPMDKHAALIARLRAALVLIGDQDITPAGRRVLEKILDAESDVG